mgnify:FL=1|tara:strand:+ start:459 stop:1004 length:546 start_codon:yes stop_codon:yes gene_type:complete
MIISTYKVNEIVQRSSIGVGNIFMYRNGNGTRYASLGLYNGFHYGYKLRSLVDEKGSYHTPVKSTITPITAETMNKECQIVGFFTLDLKFHSMPEIRTYDKATMPPFGAIISAPNFLTEDGKAHMFTNLGASIHHGDGIDLYCLTSDSNSETNVKHLPFQSLMADRGMVVLNTHEQKEKKA